MEITPRIDNFLFKCSMKTSGVFTIIFHRITMYKLNNSIPLSLSRHLIFRLFIHYYKKKVPGILKKNTTSLHQLNIYSKRYNNLYSESKIKNIFILCYVLLFFDFYFSPLSLSHASDDGISCRYCILSFSYRAFIFPCSINIIFHQT